MWKEGWMTYGDGHGGSERVAAEWLLLKHLKQDKRTEDERSSADCAQGGSEEKRGLKRRKRGKDIRRICTSWQWQQLMTKIYFQGFNNSSLSYTFVVRCSPRIYRWWQQDVCHTKDISVLPIVWWNLTRSNVYNYITYLSEERPCFT